MDSQDVKKKRRSPSFAIALVPLLTLDGLLCYLVYKGERELHLGIILAAFLATLITMVFYRTPWGRIEDAILKSSYTGLQVILFFLLAILFNSYWLRSGILPTLVYYGGNLLPPAVFPYVTLLVFALVSFATGSSWVSIGMLGPAFMTIAALLGQPQAMTAGVILSGAFLGDRLSPLALNNYLAASVAGARLADHIKYSLVTAIPSLAAVVATIIYFEPQWRSTASGSEEFLAALPRLFTINPYLLLFPLLFILLLVLRLSVIPVLFLGVLTGSILTVFYQQEPIQVLWQAAKSGSPTMMESMSRQSQTYWNLLDKGGLQDQWWTVALILCVLVFGGVMKASGMLEALPKGFTSAVRGRRTLGVMAVLGSFFTNLASPDHHLSISLPGRLLQKSLAETGAEPELLSCPLADAGPSTAALIPWSMTGIVMPALLGVEVWAYAPWAVIHWVSPLLAILFALLGVFSSKGDKPAKKSGNGQGSSPI